MVSSAFFPSIGKLREFNFRFYFPGIKDLAYDSYVLRENFFEHQYDWLNVAGETVVDIGANIGDTAIIFASKKAKYVVAYEPYPYPYSKAKKNIRLNGFEKQIKLFRVAVAGIEKELVIRTGYTGGSQSLEKKETGIVTKTTTLSRIIKEYKPSILKSDCEGSEYEIILSTPIEELAHFKQMIIDYHRRGPEILEDYLKKAGFDVKRREYDNTSGMLKCIRKNIIAKPHSDNR
ncbi:MAG: FkbM family methyltransferase [Thermoplasmata archaeon]